MAVAQVLLLAAVLLRCSSAVPACPQSCTCQSPDLLNCSSSGLTFVPQHIPDSVTELDLSDNLLDSVTISRRQDQLRNVWLGNNRITRLSLCLERSLGGRYVTGRRLHHSSGPWQKRRCVPWARTLQLLSVERNQLEQLPEGLQSCESLQVLQLSFNRISTLRPQDFSNLQQLKELNLKHNLLTSLHPQTFVGLSQLQVLDLSFNMLTSLHPSMYLSLHNIGAHVKLAGNKWKCDCSMRSLRRWMGYDSSRGLHAWNVVCASPSILSGRDLLHLEEDDLNCFTTENRPESHQSVKVFSGSEILLSCSAQDSMGWMPSGQASVNQPEAGLPIKDLTERDTGLYVCVSEEQDDVSVFNLQISKVGDAQRKARSVPGSSGQTISQGIPERKDNERNQRATSSELALAVCLSILFTFLVAFILGVLARPCIDVLWKRFCKKKSSTATVSTVEQSQYDNDAFCDLEEQEVRGAHRERRVTFSTVDFKEDSNVQYYDTVANDDQESINDDGFLYEVVGDMKDGARDSESENSSQQSPEDNQRDSRNLSGTTHAGVTITERRHSSSSDSSLSEREHNEKQMTRQDQTRPKSPQLVEDSVQQRANMSSAGGVSHVSIKTLTNEETGFSSEPFAGWSLHTNQTNRTDPDMWQGNEEQFEFSDSARSTSSRSNSVLGSFNDSKLTVTPTLGIQKRGDTSSSSSYLSEDETTHYTVNSDQEEDVTTACLKQNTTLEQHIHVIDANRPSVGINHSQPGLRKAHSFSSSSSESEGEDPCWPSLDLKHIPKIKRHLDIKAPTLASDSSSSSDSEDESTNHIKKQVQQQTEMAKYPITITQTVIHGQGTQWPIKTPSPASDSSSSSDSEDDTTKYIERPGKVDLPELGIQKPQTDSHVPDAGWPSLDLKHIPKIKRRLDIKAPSPASGSSSSSDSEDESTSHIKKQVQQQTEMAKYPITITQTVIHGQGTQWPIKTPPPASDSSSSSDSEDDTTKYIERPGKVDLPELGIQKPQTDSHVPDAGWPSLDLKHIPKIKRRLDIKAPSPASGSSSSSDSEDESTSHIKKQVQQQTEMERVPIMTSQNVSQDQGTRWPVKTTSPASDSSSSSDSEDDKAIYRERPGKVVISDLGIQKPQTESHVPDTSWPSLDLGHIPKIKRRLDIKVPSPASSSSNSEDESTNHIKKQVQQQTEIARVPITTSQNLSHGQGTKWPIKAPSPASDSSSSSDSEDESTKHIKKQEQPTNMPKPPLKGSQTVPLDPQTQWPLLDLQQTTHIKRRLDFKAKSAASDTSSSSDSEDDTTKYIERPGKVDLPELGIQKPQTDSHVPDKLWPSLDLGHIPKIKRCLDIKAPSPASDSSSSSDSEDESTNHIKKQVQQQTDITRVPITTSQNISHGQGTQWPIKAPSPASDSSSSSDCEDDKTKYIERPGKVDLPELAIQKTQTDSHVPGAGWPSLDLKHIPKIKRRLDIKAQTPASDSSSSSDSEDESTNHIKKQVQQQTEIARVPITTSQNLSHGQGTQWPIKAPSPASDSSSSSDSEDESTKHIKKQEQKTNMAKLPLKGSQTVPLDPQTQWPLLDLEHTTHIKRRLDFQAKSAASDTSSSSDSEDDKTKYIERPGNVDIPELGIQKPQTDSHVPDAGWPSLDLKHIPKIKRRLDIKAPSPASGSSSSSDSEDESTNSIKKQVQQQTEMERVPIMISQNVSQDQGTRWPVKTPSPASHSSSSSDSEDDKAINRERPGKVVISDLGIQKTPTDSHVPDTSWPSLDLRHIPKIKRRLDIKAPSPASGTSSSSDSEDDKAINRERPGKVVISDLGIQKTPTDSHVPDTSWPSLDLRHIPKIKRRLDIKAQTPASGSSSSSDSENESTNHTRKQVQQQTEMARVPITNSQNVSQDQGTRWPVKAQSPATDSSSSSDSEDESTKHLKKQVKLTDRGRIPIKESQSHDPQTQWPLLDLQQTTRLKRRLDFKAKSADSDTSTKISKSQTVEPNPILRWPELGPSAHHVTSGIDQPESSSSSDESEVETTGLHVTEVGVTSHQTGTKLPDLNMSVPLFKPHLNVKAPSQPEDSSSSSSDNERHDIAKGHVRITNSEQQTKLPKIGLGVPYMSRRLDIKAPSPQPDPVLTPVSPSSRKSESNSSTSESEDENSELAKLGLGATAISKTTENDLTESPRSPVVQIPLSPNVDHDIKLEKYKVITEKTSENINTLPVINPELESRWATMSLGVSRFRKRLEITSRAPGPSKMPSSPEPVSPASSSSSESGDEGQRGRIRQKRRGIGMQGKINAESSSKAEITPVTVSLSLKSQDKSSGTAKFKERGERPSQSQTSSSSDSENEMVDHSVPDLSLGVPRVKRRLNVKTTFPEPRNSLSSSSNAEVTGYTATQSRQVFNMPQYRDTDTLITYKRSIFQATSPSSSLPPFSGQTMYDDTKQRYPENAQKVPSYSVGDRSTPVASKRSLSRSIDGLLHKMVGNSKRTTELPPELRWTGVGRHMPDLSISSTLRRQDVGFSSPPAEPKLPPPDSSSSESDDEIKQDRGKPDITEHKNSSFSAGTVSSASTRTFDTVDNSSISTNEILWGVSEDRRQRKGLSALKAISSERQKWDIGQGNVENSASSLFDDYDPNTENSFHHRRTEEYIKPLSTQPQTQVHLSSTSVDDRGATDLLYEVPSYRRHGIRNNEPPQETPPPVPATPPPSDEALGLTWMSRPNSWRERSDGTRYYLPQSRNTGAADSSSLASQNLEVHLDFSNNPITKV
ncbi:mucin-4 isoform X1 [Labrus mixtus]|uniref:mucin-4 isoform X1 n=1 Tax=Labrus mixtus TaxID=508554 RepID=UPI0029BFDEA8|nr:mucin-4 isoform X1 [Labrus mixtus]